MNTLTKCIEELKKDKPDIRYILGMLETYLEISFGAKMAVIPPTSSQLPPVPVDEEKTPLVTAYETGKVGNIT
jgi:hypothetical protein